MAKKKTIRKIVKKKQNKKTISKSPIRGSKIKHKAKTTQINTKKIRVLVVNPTRKPIINEIKLALAISKKMVEKIDVPKIEEVI